MCDPRWYHSGQGIIKVEVGSSVSAACQVFVCWTIGRFLRAAEVMVFSGFVYALDGVWVWMSFQLVVWCCLISD